MKQWTTFDLEIATPIVDHKHWDAQRPFGISVASLHYVAEQNPRTLVLSSHDKERMPKEAAVRLVRLLQQMATKGYTIVTWNGGGFDFRTLAEESGLFDECVELCMNHVDLMFLAICHLGYRVSLSACAAVMGGPDKMRKVKLKDGRVVDITGKIVPQLWLDGEKEAVSAYVAQDALSLYGIAERVYKWGKVEWRTASGRRRWFQTGMLTVKEAAEQIPEADTSWMRYDTAVDRFKQIRWTGVYHAKKD